jgi:cyclopropane-fatty-acyl-phospholipid synthase
VLTLECWAERFDANWERIHAIDPKRFDETFHRIWRTYLYSCMEMFRSPLSYTHLFQIAYSKGNSTAKSYPMSRAHLYSGDSAG